MATTPFLGDPVLLEIVRWQRPGWELACEKLGGTMHSVDDIGTMQCDLPAELGGWTYVPGGGDPIESAMLGTMAVVGGPVGAVMVTAFKVLAASAPNAPPPQVHAKPVPRRQVQVPRSRRRRWRPVRRYSFFR